MEKILQKKNTLKLDKFMENDSDDDWDVKISNKDQKKDNDGTVEVWSPQTKNQNDKQKKKR